MTERKNDPIVGAKRFVESLNKKGEKRFQISFSAEEALKLLEAIPAELTERGFKLDMHVAKRVNQNTGVPFESPYMFVKGIQDPATFQQGGDGAPKQQVVVEKQGESMAEKIARLKNKQAE